MQSASGSGAGGCGKSAARTTVCQIARSWQRRKRRCGACSRQRVCDLEAARALRERAALAAKTEAAKPTPPTEPDSEDPRIARLKKANSELRGKLRHMHKFCEDESSKRGIMTFTTYGKILKALHPDNRPSDAEREEAFKAFSQWKQDGARRVGEDRDRGGARDDAVGLAGLASCPVAPSSDTTATMIGEVIPGPTLWLTRLAETSAALPHHVCRRRCRRNPARRPTAGHDRASGQR